MKAVIVLAMHGAPPSDFPQHELAEMMGLHARLERAAGPERETLEKRHHELENKVRSWPRTAQNDPFWAGSHELAQHLQQATGQEVIVGFGEFCAPNLDEALDQAAAKAPDKILVVTPMMTKGGGHSEEDIPEAIKLAQERHPRISIIYAWPYETREVAHFLTEHMKQFLQ